MRTRPFAGALALLAGLVLTAPATLDAQVFDKLKEAAEDAVTREAQQQADQLMVVTDRAVVLGNDPGPEARSRYEKVAFVGQVPVRVRGPVSVGDLLVASGRADGTAWAVAPGEYRPATDGPVVGQAWEASPGGTRRVDALIGSGGQAAALRSVVQRQQDQLERPKAIVERLVNSDEGDDPTLTEGSRQGVHVPRR